MNLRPSDSDVMLGASSDRNAASLRLPHSPSVMSQLTGKYLLPDAQPKMGTLLALVHNRAALLGRDDAPGVGHPLSTLARLACPWLLFTLAASCVVLPDVAKIVVAPPVVVILDQKVDPPMLVPKVLNRIEPFAQFDVNLAVETHNVTGPTYYSWYYDYESQKNIPLPFYSLCGDTPRCLFSVCAKPKSGDPSHRLLLVVSDSKLRTNPVSPVDFPDGAAFDTIQWQLNLINFCPDNQKK